MDSLTSQMERLLNMQHVVLSRLDSLSQDVRGMGRDLTSMREEGAGGGGWGRRGSEVEAACRELRGSVERVSERVENQGRRLEGVEKLVEGTQQVLSYIGEVVKSSRLVELLFKQPGRKVKPKVRGRIINPSAGHGVICGSFRLFMNSQTSLTEFLPLHHLAL